MARKLRPPAPFPSRQQVLDFIRASTVPVGKREIARAFHLDSDSKVMLRDLLRKLQDEGVLERGAGRRLNTADTLPAVAVLQVTGIDADGETLAQPVNWPENTPAPRIFVQPERRGHPALAVGDRVLAKLTRVGDDADLYEARTIRKLDNSRLERIVGVFDRGRIRPADRRAKSEFSVTPEQSMQAQSGELVVAESIPGNRMGLKRARIIERLGTAQEPRAVSLIAIHQNGIPTRFSEAALAEAEAATEADLAGRVDLRDYPLVTIDGADARDFDDAVWAEADPDPTNIGGWHLLVAIADVSHYVRPGSALDRAAYERGNSCYFPDRVVPMLPEALSNELCSLKPGVNRACLAVHLWIDRDGNLQRHQFVRGLMRSAARLTYEQVQAVHDGGPTDDGPTDDSISPSVIGPLIAPLYGAFAALSQARTRRGTLELDLPERQVKLDQDGRITSITVRQRLDSHRLIEEFMIAANVAAAEALEAKRAPCLYRLHAEPARDKLDPLREFLRSLGYSLPKGQVIKPIAFTQILNKAAETPETHLINTVILRAQAQAVYGPENIGHFGLALRRYAHFTSPIRRYADLIVHRSLVRAWGLGDGGLDAGEAQRLAEIGEHISATERRAATAERDANDRYIAAWLADRVGATFSGRIGGVTRFGLFVTLDETGADGIVPIASLGNDFYDHDEKQHALVGRRHGQVFRLGTPVKVRLVEADALAGSLVLRLADSADAQSPVKPRRFSRNRKQ